MKNEYKIYFLYGDDDQLVSANVRNILCDLSQNNSLILTLEKIEINSISDVDILINKFSNLSLFPNACVLKVFINLKTFKNIEKDYDPFLISLKNLLMLKNVILLLNLEKYDKTVKTYFSNSKLILKLKEFSVFQECIKLKPWQKEEIKSKILLVCKKYNLSIENKSLDLFNNYFKDKVEYIDAEIEKLATYLYPSQVVTEQLIQSTYKYVSNVDDIYQFVLQKHFQNSSWLQKQSVLTNSLYLLASLQNKFREAFQIKLRTQKSMNLSQISKDLGINFYMLEKEFLQLKNVSLSYLKEVIKTLSDIEFRLKTGIIREDEALDILILKLARN